MLRHEWSDGPEVKVTVAYIDPANVIAASYEMTIKDKDRVLNHKPEFTLPLRPGVWRVKLLYLWQDVAEVGFVVLPMTQVYGKRITQQQAEDLNNGPEGNHYVDHDFKEMESTLGLKDTDKLRLQADRNGKLTGRKLDIYVDSLLKQIWKVSDTCISGERGSMCSKMHSCEKTTWSSTAPDPKSKVAEIDKKTGTLVRAPR